MKQIDNKTNVIRDTLPGVTLQLLSPSDSILVSFTFLCPHNHSTVDPIPK